jgi:hypothetical protein
MAVLAGLTLIAAMLLMPGIFRMIKRERPDFIYVKPLKE